MKFEPRAMQWPMIRVGLTLPRCALWASMGSGKTSAVLYILSVLSLIRPFRALVVGPKRVIESTWPDQLQRFDEFHGLSFSVVAGDTKRCREKALMEDVSIYCINFENLQWLHDNKNRPTFDVVVIDEATRIKSFRLRKGSKRAKALYQMCKEDKVSRIIELTGTPGSNGLIDLWGQMYFVDNGVRLGKTFSAFTARWFDTIQTDVCTKYKPKPPAITEIPDLVKDVCVTVRTEDYYELEAPIERNIYIDFDEKLQKLYSVFEKEMFARIGEADVGAVNAGVLTQKCLQFTSGAIYGEERELIDVHDLKIAALESLIEEMNGEPIIVAYHFVHEIDRIRKHFPGAVVFSETKDAESRWNAGETPLLLLHPMSAGHGLNLQWGGRTMVFFTNWWAPEPRQQIIERIGPLRQKQAGFDRSVYVYNLVIRGTIDERVLMAHRYKMGINEALRAGAVRQ